ncbi:hypothetical protein HDU81_005124 [Chytriomyces hyalinus]|nr:hypothetical protein HDU81_005124 [Chytriomyces hyalinus]
MDSLAADARSICSAYLENKDLDGFLTAANALLWRCRHHLDTVASTPLPPSSISLTQRINNASSKALASLHSKDGTFRNFDETLLALPVSASEMNARIASNVSKKRSAINDSNRSEFVRTNSADDSSSARVSAAAINRNIQMKIDMVHNSEGPLARSTVKNGSLMNSTLEAAAKSTASVSMSVVESRLDVLAQHLRVKFDPNSALGMHQRLKILEDAIVAMEEKYPVWSSVHLNHEAEEGVVRDPFGPAVWTRVCENSDGEVTLAVSIEDGSEKRRRIATNAPLGGVTESAAGQSGGAGARETEMEALNKRIAELKSNLLNMNKG